MNIEQWTGRGNKEDAVPQQRKGYESPVLTAFGAIHHATQGTGAMAQDANNTMTMMGN